MLLQLVFRALYWSEYHVQASTCWLLCLTHFKFTYLLCDKESWTVKILSKQMFCKICWRELLLNYCLGKLYGKINWRISKRDDDFIERNTVQTFKQVRPWRKSSWYLKVTYDRSTQRLTLTCRNLNPTCQVSFTHVDFSGDLRRSAAVSLLPGIVKI